MKRKLKSNRGETLVEVLAAILIGALSVALLFTAVMASANMDKAAKAVDKAYSAVLTNAEKQKDVFSPFPDTVADDAKKVTVANGSSEAKVSVTFYGGDGALSYKLS